MIRIARSDRRLLSSSAATRRVRIELQVPSLSFQRKRPPLNLGLVLDRSGSMEGDKLALTQSAASAALRALSPGDRFSIVTYSDEVSVLVPATAVSADAVERAVGALRTLHAGGWTDLGAGWLTGCAQVDVSNSDSALGRCLLLTDGLANRRITDPDELVRHAAELRRRGVTTSTLGVGSEFDEGLLRRLADAGGGRFYYADRAEQIPEMVGSEVGEALDTAAREARIWVRCPPQVWVRSLNGDPCALYDGRWCIQLGALRAGEQRSCMLELGFPAGSAGETESVSIALSDRDGVLPVKETLLAWRRVSDAEADREPPDLEVVREHARLEVAATHVRALELLRHGAEEEALACVDTQIARLRTLAGDDPNLRALLHELEQSRPTYQQAYHPATGKPLHFRAYRSLKEMALAGPNVQPRQLALRWFEPALAPIVAEAHRALLADSLSAGVNLRAVPVSGAARFWGNDVDTISVEEEGRMVEAAASPSSGLSVAFTLRQLHDNWFSHWHPQQRVALVSLHGWQQMSSIRHAALVAYEGLLHGLRVLSPQYDPLAVMHRETRGCLFDFCERKEEVEIKLQAGHVCDACTERLGFLGFDPDAVSRVWSAVQQLAHPPSSAQPRP